MVCARPWLRKSSWVMVIGSCSCCSGVGCSLEQLLSFILYFILSFTEEFSWLVNWHFPCSRLLEIRAGDGLFIFFCGDWIGFSRVGEVSSPVFSVSSLGKFRVGVAVEASFCCCPLRVFGAGDGARASFNFSMFKKSLRSVPTRPPAFFLVSFVISFRFSNLLIASEIVSSLVPKSSLRDLLVS